MPGDNNNNCSKQQTSSITTTNDCDNIQSSSSSNNNNHLYQGKLKSKSIIVDASSTSSLNENRGRKSLLEIVDEELLNRYVQHFLRIWHLFRL